MFYIKSQKATIWTENNAYTTQRIYQTIAKNVFRTTMHHHVTYCIHTYIYIHNKKLFSRYIDFEGNKKEINFFCWLSFSSEQNSRRKYEWCALHAYDNIHIDIAFCNYLWLSFFTKIFLATKTETVALLFLSFIVRKYYLLNT